MAQPVSTPKIEELRARLRAEPGSRMFYQLAEELRKAGQGAEAEQVLQAGLTGHQTYLAAWVSLGRVLREQKRDGEAIDALSRAMQIDPENVVAARLLGDCYLEVGEKVEAIKKYKFVQALMPGDEELDLAVQNLERELGPPEEIAVERSEPETAEPLPAEATSEQPVPDEVPDASLDAAPAEESPDLDGDSPFATDLPLETAAAAMEREHEIETETADAEPMLAAHDVSPFEEPVDSYSAAAVEIEAPAGFQVESAPVAADLPSTFDEALPDIESAPATPAVDEASEEVFASAGLAESDEYRPEAGTTSGYDRAAGDDADVFAPAGEPFDPDETASRPADLTSTITMADLYVAQGLTDDARQIYESILTRDPGNAGVRARLESLLQPPPAAPETREMKVERLRRWLTKVSRKEVGSV